MAMADKGMRRGIEAEIPNPADPAGMDALMRRVFDQSRGQATEGTTPAIVPSAAKDPAPRRDFDMASDLLDRASQAFDLLIARCQRFEQEIDDAHEHARVEAAKQADAIEQWKRLAAGLKAQADASEGAVAVLKTRCEAAEARAAMAEQRAAALERASAQAASHAALAENLSTRLHDKVVTAFGIGSRAHPVLEAVATQHAAE